MFKQLQLISVHSQISQRFQPPNATSFKDVKWVTPDLVIGLRRGSDAPTMFNFPQNLASRSPP